MTLTLTKLAISMTLTKIKSFENIANLDNVDDHRDVGNLTLNNPDVFLNDLEDNHENLHIRLDR